MRFVPAFAAAVALTGVVGIGMSACGDDLRSCQNACQKAFESSSCNLQVPGQDQDELILDCTRECGNALRETGDLDNYDPNDFNSVPRTESFELQNERQAAVWMDCVLDSTCDRLQEGYCPGGGIN